MPSLDGRVWAEVRVWVKDKQDQSLGRDFMAAPISFPPSTPKPQKQQDRTLYKQSSQRPYHRKLRLRVRNTTKPHLLHLLARVTCNEATKSVPAVHVAGSSGFRMSGRLLLKQTVSVIWGLGYSQTTLSIH